MSDEKIEASITRVLEWVKSTQLLDRTKRPIEYPDEHHRIVIPLLYPNALYKGTRLNLSVVFPADELVLNITQETRVPHEFTVKFLAGTQLARNQLKHEYYALNTQIKSVAHMKFSLPEPLFYGFLNEIYLDSLSKDRFFRRLNAVGNAAFQMMFTFSMLFLSEESESTKDE